MGAPSWLARSPDRRAHTDPCRDAGAGAGICLVRCCWCWSRRRAPRRRRRPPGPHPVRQGRRPVGARTAQGAHQLATGGTFSQPNWAPDGSEPGLRLSRHQLRRHLRHRRPGPEPDAADQLAVDHSRQQRLELPARVVAGRQAHRVRVRPRVGLSDAVADERADGSGRRALATPGLQEEAVDALAWSPDGSQLAVTLFNEPGPTQIGARAAGRAGRQAGARADRPRPAARSIRPGRPTASWLAFAGHDGPRASRSTRMQPGRHVGRPALDQRRPTGALAGLEPGRAAHRLSVEQDRLLRDLGDRRPAPTARACWSPRRRAS